MINEAYLLQIETIVNRLRRGHYESPSHLYTDLNQVCLTLQNEIASEFLGDAAEGYRNMIEREREDRNL